MESTLSHITPEPERARRYTALRAAMDEQGLDAMLICGRGDETARGRIQYITDTFQWAGWAFVLLPREQEAVYVGDPLWGVARAEAAGWVDRFKMAHDPGPAIAQAVADLGLLDGTLGLVGAESATTGAHLQSIEDALPKVSFTDATASFDGVRAIKSEFEVEKLTETAQILKTVFEALAERIRPGVQERMVLAEAHRLVRQAGCLDGIATMSRPPFRYFGGGSDVPIQPDDIVVIDLEWAGPSGYWVELRRCFSFGEPSAEVRAFWDLRRESYQACVDAIRPGVMASDVATARDGAYRRHGYPPADSLRYTLHGIGIDSLESPWIPGNDGLLQAGMVLSLHPEIHIDDPERRARAGGISISDNVLVTGTGATRMADQDVELVIL